VPLLEVEVAINSKARRIVTQTPAGPEGPTAAEGSADGSVQAITQVGELEV
jgi:hypothetical protein